MSLEKKINVIRGGAMAVDAIEIQPGAPNVYYEQGIVKGEETKPLMASAPYGVDGSFYLQRQPHYPNC
jgi:aldehyde oxidoreductase